jgi:sporulation protein YlmC with PRC-barrel domain
MDATETAQPIDIGADVIGSDGKKVGTVAYVVVPPAEMRITDIVVRTGAILYREVVVPVPLVRDVQNGKVYLSIDKDELQKYPEYVEVDYRKPPSVWVPPEGVAYPPMGILWPAGAYDPAAAGVRVNAPPGTLGIREGMEVESSDGHKVGAVDALDIDLAIGDIRGFVVKHGFLRTRDTRIPAGDVQAIRDGKVILKLTKDQVQQVEQAQSQSKG